MPDAFLVGHARIDQMNPLTALIPFRDGSIETLISLIESIPDSIPIIIIDDESNPPLESEYHPYTSNRIVQVIRRETRGYFAGAVNAGIQACSTDVLILNQDVTLQGVEWLEMLERNQGAYDLIGGGVMNHPAWPSGYVQGQFMYMSRRAINRVGLLNERDYPLWGCTAEWQLRACRQGFKALPMPANKIPGFHHLRKSEYGDAIAGSLRESPDLREWLIRTPPAVSVIIPAYNYGRYLTDCIHSLIGGPTALGEHPGQTFQSFEVIIVDDASTDSTQEIGESLANPWTGVRYIRRPHNGGTPAANNTGIKAAFGKFITILCADDMREPWAIESLYRACSFSPRIVAYDDLVIFRDGKRKTIWPMGEYNFDLLLYKNHMHAGIMFSKEAWKAAGGYPEIMREGREDWAMNVALGLKGFCGLHVPRAGYLYRREKQNRTLTNTTPEYRQFFLGQLRSLFPDVYNQGVKPMACCGGGGAKKKSNGNGGGGGGESAVTMGSGEVVGFQSEFGTTVLEYVGGSIGTTGFTGPVSKRRYIVSRKRNMVTVDNRDVPALLHLIGGNRRPVFLRVRAGIPQDTPAETPIVSPIESLKSSLPEPYTDILEGMEAVKEFVEEKEARESLAGAGAGQSVTPGDAPGEALGIPEAEQGTGQASPSGASLGASGKGKTGKGRSAGKKATADDAPPVE